MQIVAESIDRFISVKMNQASRFRGVIPRLYEAARARQGEPLTLAAARRLCEAAASGGTVFIATGHVHPVLLPYGETDGPPGAAILARAIRLGLTTEVVLLSEAVVTEVLRTTCRAAGLGVGDSRSHPSGEPGAPRSVSIMAFPTDPQEARRKAQDLLDGSDPVAVITIEKVGRNRVGVYHTGAGNDVSNSLAKVDLLVDEANRRNILTIGIGDVGNEIGFGSIQDTVRQVVPRADRCLCPCGEGTACDVPVDCLVVAGCSNWGAYGIAALLGVLTSQPDLLHTGDIEKRMIWECCRAGAVDGLSTGPTLEVDGLSWETHGRMVDVLKVIAATPTPGHRTARAVFEEEEGTKS